MPAAPPPWAARRAGRRAEAGSRHVAVESLSDPRTSAGDGHVGAKRGVRLVVRVGPASPPEPYAQQFAVVLESAERPALELVLVCPFMVKTVRPRPSSFLPSFLLPLRRP